MSAGHPTRRISFKLSEIAVYFSQEQDGYFLYVKFRIATISKAVLTIKLSSSYVLIIITTFRKDSESGESTSPGCPGKYIILFRSPGGYKSAGVNLLVSYSSNAIFRLFLRKTFKKQLIYQPLP